MKYVKKIGKMKRNRIQKGDLIIAAPSIKSHPGILNIPRLVIEIRGTWISFWHDNDTKWVKKIDVERYYG